MHRKKNQKTNKLKKIQAGGGVLYRIENGETQILLIKRNGVWDLPKGKKEKGENLEKCAVREVCEEVGVTSVKISGFLCNTYHEYREGTYLIGKSTAWYAMHCDNQNEELQPETEEGITELLWTDVEEGLEKVGYENLIKVIRAFCER